MNDSRRLDPVDPEIRASGLDVLDLSITKQLRRWIELNFSIDNLTDKRYFETQNYFDSMARVIPLLAHHKCPLAVFGGLEVGEEYRDSQFFSVYRMKAKAASTPRGLIE